MHSLVTRFRYMDIISRGGKCLNYIMCMHMSMWYITWREPIVSVKRFNVDEVLVTHIKHKCMGSICAECVYKHDVGIVPYNEKAEKNTINMHKASLREDLV